MRIVSPNVSRLITPVRPQIRWKSVNSPLGGKEKVKFRKEDVKRLFRFAQGEGYVIIGE